VGKQDIQVASDYLMTLADDELLALTPYKLSDIRKSAKRMGKCPIIPHPRQREFLDIDDQEEGLFGGAVGGAKTEALELWLSEGVRHANFSGLFLRRTFPELEGSPTSPLERSRRIFSPMGGILSGRTWTFPNNAMVTFSAMNLEKDKHKYDGHEYHRIAFDQVEQFTETQYTYMFSRLRRTVGFPIGCGIRSSANPIGGNWVRRRFVSDEAIKELAKYTAYDASPAGMVFDCPGTQGFFMPSRIADNPSIEVNEYVERLRLRLSAVLAAKLANGDWSVREGSVINGDNFRYYSTHMSMLEPLLGMEDPVRFNPANARRFAVVDTAGTSKQKAEESKGKPASWSVCSIWDHYPKFGLFLRHVWRERVGWPDLRDEIRKVLSAWGNPQCLIENAHHGQVLAAEIKHSILQPTVIAGMKKSDSGAKYDRAVAAGLFHQIEEGKFWLPEVATVEGVSRWMPEFESELLAWTGLPEETADQIDVCSYAVNYVRLRQTSWGGVVPN
jgi:phage terminase large subunit-like protein